jgi:hypothetical protein
MVQQRELDDTAQRQTSPRVRVNLQVYKKELTGIQLSIQERTAHLPKLIADVIFRLRLSAAARVNPSVFARQHSELRRKQRLHRSNAGRRSANPGSEHLQHSAQESPNYSCRQVAARHHTIADEVDSQFEANNAQLHGPFPETGSQESNQLGTDRPKEPQDFFAGPSSRCSLFSRRLLSS